LAAPARKPASPTPPASPTGPGPRRTSDRPAPARRRRSVWGFLARWTAVLSIWAFVGVAAVVGWFAWDMPDMDTVELPTRRPSITLLAADGSEFLRLGDLVGDLVDSRELPRHLIQAVLAVEDRRFFSHFGIDPIGLARAIWVNHQAGRTVQGGSTITQQLAKNLFLTPERSVRRKVQEALIALWLDHRYEKHEILTAYLNRVYLGAGTFGVDAAARTYFGKSATRVDLREAAVLAGLLKAPSRFAPTNDPAESLKRASVVLDTMVDAGFIGETQATLAKSASLSGGRTGPGGSGRHFADWVAEQVGAYVGREPRDLIVKTTLDIRMQAMAEQKVRAALDGPGAQARAGQAAMVMMTPDGAVRALVGGRDWSDSPFNRATRALRQPGSAFKPFVFLAALEAGMTPDTLVEDAPIRIGRWAPENFEPGFRGPVTLTTALAQSINTSAVRLLDRAGLDRTREVARALGITRPLARNLSLALGTSEVTLVELTGAYGAFANGGRSIWPHAIAEIQDRQGRVLYRRQGGGGTGVTYPAGRIAQLDRMLAAVVEEGTGRAARLDRPAGGKTGTTQGFRDAWFVGFTADYVAGVWMGNDDNTPMTRVTGGGLPARLWREVMLEAHQGLPARPLRGIAAPPPPEGTPPVARTGPDGSAGDPLMALIRRLATGGPGPSRGEDVPEHLRGGDGNN
jgi:penicillin-binding protein 1A